MRNKKNLLLLLLLLIIIIIIIIITATITTTIVIILLQYHHHHWLIFIAAVIISNTIPPLTTTATIITIIINDITLPTCGFPRNVLASWSQSSIILANNLGGNVLLFNSTIIAVVGYFSGNCSKTTTFLNFVLLKQWRKNIGVNEE